MQKCKNVIIKNLAAKVRKVERKTKKIRFSFAFLSFFRNFANKNI